MTKQEILNLRPGDVVEVTFDHDKMMQPFPDARWGHRGKIKSTSTRVLDGKLRIRLEHYWHPVLDSTVFTEVKEGDGHCRLVLKAR